MEELEIVVVETKSYAEDENCSKYFFKQTDIYMLND